VIEVGPETAEVGETIVSFSGHDGQVLSRGCTDNWSVAGMAKVAVPIEENQAMPS
jgi:hypothetical protein